MQNNMGMSGQTYRGVLLFSMENKSFSPLLNLTYPKLCVCRWEGNRDALTCSASAIAHCWWKPLKNDPTVRDGVGKVVDWSIPVGSTLSVQAMMSVRQRRYAIFGKVALVIVVAQCSLHLRHECNLVVARLQAVHADVEAGIID